MHVPGNAKYKGNRPDLAHRLVGPTTYGSWLAVDEVSYDPVTDVTTAKFRNATIDDFERATPGYKAWHEEQMRNQSEGVA